MPTCPKCQFDSPDLDQCERCGIIFDRMHTIVDLRPLGALGEALAARGARVAKPDPAPAPAPTADGPHPPERRAPHVAMVPRTAEPRLRGWFVAVAVLVLAAVALSVAAELRSRRHVQAAAEEDGPVPDAAYFDLAIDDAVAECRQELRRITDPARGAEVQARLVDRVARLQALLGDAPLPPAQRAADAEALAALATFLADDVPRGLAAARELGGRAEPLSPAALERAAAALARARR